jgi:2,4-dienoyl-CoA reductase-like NADH-dependent reductase (Old Yellow Enzyme family)/thioredoxin reductase
VANKLFESVTLGSLQLKNRLVMTAMSTCFAGPTGQVTDRLTEYYAARASGGAALITVEEAFIHPQLPHVKNALGAYGDHLIPGLSRLTQRIHEEGALVSLQLGLYFRQQLNGFPRYAASTQAPDCGPNCKELTIAEIQYLTDLFVAAAERTRRAGFDAVEIHACHGCIISEFLSPFWNHRSDEYGGSREGRFRFALDILQAMRARLGDGYPIIYRISGSEFAPKSFTPEDAVALSKMLDGCGVSAISISGGLGHVNHIAIPPGDVSRGLLLPIGKAVKEAVRVPVIVGNSMTPDIARNAVDGGMADLIGLGRPLIADPEWPRKVAEGRLEDIRCCLRCNQGCFGAVRDPRRPWISCMYNPLAGREFENPITPSEVVKRVVIVGGGPAGCEVARVCKLRGHLVTLLEKAECLGGQIRLAAVPPAKGDFGKMPEFYEHELRRLGVDIRLKTMADQALLNALDADVYVFATGMEPTKPPIPGVGLPHVVTAHEILSGKVENPTSPVVVIGGGASGLETADLLAARGHRVTVVEILDTVGRDIPTGIGVREALMHRLHANSVILLMGHRAIEITPETVRVSDRPLVGGGQLTDLPARSVALALGGKPQTPATQDTLPKKALCYWVGDCWSPGNALDAIHQAFALAVKL